jgi:hypothetical protein
MENMVGKKYSLNVCVKIPDRRTETVAQVKKTVIHLQKQGPENNGVNHFKQNISA